MNFFPDKKQIYIDFVPVFRSEQVEHPERPEHLEHLERPEHLEHLERPEHLEHLEHLEHPGTP